MPRPSPIPVHQNFNGMDLPYLEMSVSWWISIKSPSFLSRPYCLWHGDRKQVWVYLNWSCGLKVIALWLNYLFLFIYFWLLLPFCLLFFFSFPQIWPSLIFFWIVLWNKKGKKEETRKILFICLSALSKIAPIQVFMLLKWYLVCTDVLFDG